MAFIPCSPNNDHGKPYESLKWAIEQVRKDFEAALARMDMGPRKQDPGDLVSHDSHPNSPTRIDATSVDVSR